LDGPGLAPEPIPFSRRAGPSISRPVFWESIPFLAEAAFCLVCRFVFFAGLTLLRHFIRCLGRLGIAAYPGRTVHSFPRPPGHGFLSLPAISHTDCLVAHLHLLLRFYVTGSYFHAERLQSSSVCRIRFSGPLLFPASSRPGLPLCSPRRRLQDPFLRVREAKLFLLRVIEVVTPPRFQFFQGFDPLVSRPGPSLFPRPFEC